MTIETPGTTAYDLTQFDDNFPAGIEDHYWFKARNVVLDRALKQAERQAWIPAAASILEVGCGPGVVVQALRARGHNVRGVELGRPPRVLVPDRIQTGIQAQALEPAHRTEFDALMFLDVIEHVPDDVALLRDTLAAFPRCRAVFITVPARPELWSDHDRYYGHYRRYTRRSLARTLCAAGLEPVETRYVFRSLYLAAALIKIGGRQRNPIMRAPATGTLHHALAALLATEDRLLAAAPLPGLSVLGVGVRPIG